MREQVRVLGEAVVGSWESLQHLENFRAGYRVSTGRCPDRDDLAVAVDLPVLRPGATSTTVAGSCKNVRC
jgi:hypothetical protein